MESGTVAAGEIDAAMRQRLLATRDETLRLRLAKLFASGTSADRIAP